MTAPTLYLDLASPYAYLAAARASSVLGRPVEFQPVLLGAIFKRRGWGSWAESDGRAAGTAEIEERARRYGLPAIVWPEDWPANALTADRAAIWAKQQGVGEEFVRDLYRRQFASGADITSLGVLAGSAAEVGLDPHELPDAVQRPDIKSSLRLATDEAWDLGVRGVPSVAIGRTVFFGDDRMEEAARLLRQAARMRTAPRSP